MSWAVAKTLPLYEDKLRIDLESLDFICYLPKFMHCYTPFKGGKICRKIALFPGYLFFKFESEWKRIFNGERKISLIMSNELPCLIKDKDIDLLKQQEGADGLIKVDSVVPLRKRFYFGQRVRATQGLFQGYIGRFERDISNSRIRVLFTYMGREVPIVMHCEEVCPEESRHAARRRYYRNRNRYRQPVPSHH